MLSALTAEPVACSQYVVNVPQLNENQLAACSPFGQGMGTENQNSGDWEVGYRLHGGGGGGGS